MKCLLVIRQFYYSIVVEESNDRGTSGQKQLTVDCKMPVTKLMMILHSFANGRRRRKTGDLKNRDALNEI